MNTGTSTGTPGVIACIDASRSALAVCDYAAWCAQRLQSVLTLLHVLDHSSFPVPGDLSGNIGLGSRELLLQELAELDEKRARLMREQGRHLLDVAAERVRAQGIVEPLQRQRHGGLVESLQELESEMRLLVMGRQGEEGDSLGQHVGSHLESVVRTLHRPILVTTGEFSVPRRLMLAFDNGPSTRKGVEMLAVSPLFKGLPVHLLQVGADTGDARAALDEAAERLRRAGHDVHSEIRAGEVEATLLGYEQEHDIDLIVMGAYGHSRIRQFFVGSTTTNLLARTRKPLLLLR